MPLINEEVLWQQPMTEFSSKVILYKMQLILISLKGKLKYLFDNIIFNPVNLMQYEICNYIFGDY